ncbi:MAG TPA: hypothetical protein VGR94_01795 [Candidatus Acidoferrales bacterium]|nr:hypothetical protein [Candidatus Acidoferrales bacterium]
MESQTGGAALTKVIVAGLGSQLGRVLVRALYAISVSALLRLVEISALLIDSTKCFILLKEKSLVKAYSGTAIAVQILGGVI